jgi:hypothetical protein
MLFGLPTLQTVNTAQVDEKLTIHHTRSHANQSAYNTDHGLPDRRYDRQHHRRRERFDIGRRHISGPRCRRRNSSRDVSDRLAAIGLELNLRLSVSKTLVDFRRRGGGGGGYRAHPFLWSFSWQKETTQKEEALCGGQRLRGGTGPDGC